MTAHQDPGPDPHRAARDARREQERGASRARQQAAYQRDQRASRSRALRAAAAGTGAQEPAPGAETGRSARSATPPLVRAWLDAGGAGGRPATEQTAVELAQQRLEEAELERALLGALAALPADQRVAVVAALGYAEGPVGAAVELGIDPQAAERLAQQGLDALRLALSPFRTHDD